MLRRAAAQYSNRSVGETELFRGGWLQRKHPEFIDCGHMKATQVPYCLTVLSCDVKADRESDCAAQAYGYIRSEEILHQRELRCVRREETECGEF